MNKCNPSCHVSHLDEEEKLETVKALLSRKFLAQNTTETYFSY